MRKLPLIIVDWDDTCTNSGWKSDKDDFTQNGIRCHSVGWQLKSNRKHLIITPMRDIVNNDCQDRQIIPRGCITGIRRLE